MKVAQATGILFQRGEHRHRAVIGKDTRLSGYMIETAMVAGFTSVGVDVLLLGPMPTPAVAMLTHSMRADVGVMISASHNPFEDNGIKLFGPDGFKLSDEVEANIEAMLDERSAASNSPKPPISAAPCASKAIAPAISNSPSARLPRNLSLDGLRIVVDCANGAAYKVAPEALWELGAEVFSIGVEPGRLQHQPRRRLDRAEGAGQQGPRDARRYRHCARRRRRPRHHRRRTRQIVDGDQLMAVIAESWTGGRAAVAAGHRRDRDVQSRPRALSRAASASPSPAPPVGDRYVLEHMREHGYNLGGEQSGHVILSRLLHDRRRARGRLAIAWRSSSGSSAR